VKILSLICLFSLFSIKAHASTTPTPKQCESTKEYQTTTNFLRSKKFLYLKEEDIRNVANQVSSGCTNASKRFIMITNLLIKAQMDSKSAIENAIKFSASTDAKADTFINIFKYAFVRNFLDLDVFNATKLANELSLDFEGDSQIAFYDFQTIVKYCVSQDQLDLPKRKCSEMASTIVRHGQTYNQNMGTPFIELFEFLVKSNGANLPTYKAIETATQVFQYGPKAGDNFQKAYEFAKNKKGLDMDENKSLEFALEMAKKTKPVL